MNSNTIDITIKGKAGSGKSTIATLISKVLATNGIPVTIDIQDAFDRVYTDQEVYNTRLTSITKNGGLKISIYEEQRRR